MYRQTAKGDGMGLTFFLRAFFVLAAAVMAATTSGVSAQDTTDNGHQPWREGPRGICESGLDGYQCTLWQQGYEFPDDQGNCLVGSLIPGEASGLGVDTCQTFEDPGYLPPPNGGGEEIPGPDPAPAPDTDLPPADAGVEEFVPDVIVDSNVDSAAAASAVIALPDTGVGDSFHHEIAPGNSGSMLAILAGLVCALRYGQLRFKRQLA